MAKKYRLNLLNCLMLGGTLPSEGKINTMKVVRKLAEDLALTVGEEASIEYLELRDKGQIRWNAEKARSITKSVTISTAALDEIVTALRDLEDKGKLTVSHVDLWDLFVMNQGLSELVEEEGED